MNSEIFYCTNCGRELEIHEVEDALSSYGEPRYNRNTGEKYKEVTRYLECPRNRWWNGDDKLYDYVRMVYV